MPTCDTCGLTANGMGWSSHLTGHRARQERIIITKSDGQWVYDYSPRPADVENRGHS